MTKIQWTDITSNPIHLVKPDGSHGGHWCRKADRSPGCANCYSEAQNQSDFFKFASHLKYTGEAPENLILDDKILKDLIKMKTPKKIFICSMTDLFGDWISDEWICKVFAYMCIAKQHTFQILTKRPERMKEFFEIPMIKIGIANYIDEYFEDKFAHQDYYMPACNVWLGVTCENQRTLAERLPILLETPAKVRFLSCEPLLEDIYLGLDELFDVCPELVEGSELGEALVEVKDALDWVIVGGESGNHARPCHINWIRSIVKQCQNSNVPVFVKQLGSEIVLSSGECINLKSKGGDIEAFPEDLRIREFPIS
jgi:protein gp37